MPSAGELRGAEVADDGGVGEQEQRLGDQGEEGRDRQPQDLPVLGAPAWPGLQVRHPTSLPDVRLMMAGWS